MPVKTSTFTLLKPTRNSLWIAISIICCLSLTGCIRVYKKDIRQGNYVTQEMVTQLRPHMSKFQVQNIMGTPTLVPIFRLSRWDYYYSFKSGSTGETEAKLLSLYFDGDYLRSYSGDWNVPNLPRKS